MEPSQISKILLDRYQSGDSLAASEIWTRYAMRLKSLAQRRISPSLAAKTDPEDVLQTTFMEFFEKAKKDEVHWQQRGDLWRLLASIAIHHVLRQAERFAAAKRNVSREQPAAELSLVQNDQQIARRMDAILEPLLSNDSILSTVLLGRLAGKTLAEIADQTGKSQRTLRRVLQKAKMALIADSEIQTGLEIPVAADEALSARYEDYDLLKLIGAGGFGKVYLARDRINDCFLAIKALKRVWIGNAAAESLFLNEVTTIAALKHPNIVRFHKAGPLPNGSWFMVLDFAAGSSLDAIDFSRVRSRDAADWIRQIASALTYLHGQGVVHGDLKPTNILVTNGGAQLIDFGFSRQTGDRNPQWYGGTRQYGAPEKQSSTAADVYSFGKIIQYVHRQIQPLDASTNDALNHLIRDACANEPSDRPSSAEMLAVIQSSI